MRNDDSTRQIVRSRTTMSYAFEASVHGLVRDIRSGGAVSPARRDLGLMIASTAEVQKGRKTPTWTVTRKEPRR
jgi:hypothetical protein